VQIQESGRGAERDVWLDSGAIFIKKTTSEQSFFVLQKHFSVSYRALKNFSYFCIFNHNLKF
jgi:hypothetical protein